MTSEYIVDEGIRSAHVGETNWDPAGSNLVQHAETELRAQGLFEQDSDYDGMLGQAVMELIVLFASQRHSGYSAGMTLDLFKRLASFEPLSPLTDNPEEWMEVSSGLVDRNEPPLWQNRRQATAFSNDGGKTYYDLDEPLQPDGTPTMNTSKNHKEN
jgi:hypothetical protein